MNTKEQRSTLPPECQDCPSISGCSLKGCIEPERQKLWMARIKGNETEDLAERMVDDFIAMDICWQEYADDLSPEEKKKAEPFDIFLSGWMRCRRHILGPDEDLNKSQNDN